MLSLSAGAESLQASNDPVLSDSDIRNVATDAIRNAARLNINLNQGFERAEAFFRRAEGSARLTQVLLIECSSGDDQTKRTSHCTAQFEIVLCKSLSASGCMDMSCVQMNIISRNQIIDTA